MKLPKPGDAQLVSAAGEPMPIGSEVKALVQVGQLRVEHPFLAHLLITPVILDMDFLQQHGLVPDFASITISVRSHNVQPNSDCQLQDI